MSNQSAKADRGKLRLSLVPPQIMTEKPEEPAQKPAEPVQKPAEASKYENLDIRAYLAKHGEK